MAKTNNSPADSSAFASPRRSPRRGARRPDTDEGIPSSPPPATSAPSMNIIMATPTAAATRRSGNVLVGRRVRKKFIVPGARNRKTKFYDGSVHSYRYEDGLYKIVYEDDDVEDMNEEGVLSVLVPLDDDEEESPEVRVVTPEAVKTGRSDNGGKTDNDDEGRLNIRAMTTPTASRRVSKRRKATKANYKNDNDSKEGDEDDYSMSAAHNDGDRDAQEGERLIEEAVAKKAKDTPRTRRTKRTKSTKGGRKATGTKERVSPNSVAVRGLPQGSRAIGRNGFEIRTLDGIPPLLTVGLVQRAIDLIATGQHQAAAHLVCLPDHQHDAIKAFCKAACRKLGMKPPTSTSLEGGSELSERALQRLEQGTVDVHADLPGRLLVVRAGYNTGASDDSMTKEDEEMLCPIELEGNTFDSAAELHALTKVRLATYADMQVTQETPFCPGDVMVQRLVTASLLPPLDDDQESCSPCQTKSPFVVAIHWDGGESTLPTGTWQMYQNGMIDDNDTNMRWALLEGATRDAPPVVVGASSLLNENENSDSGGDPDTDIQSEQPMDLSNSYKTNAKGCGLLPQLSPVVAQVRLPASLLRKCIQRNFCSPAPILEACQALLHGEPHDGDDTSDESIDSRSEKKRSARKSPPRGGVFAMLCTTWRCMLEDASPFDSPDDGSLLGIEEVMLLSLVAKADESWQMPQALLRKAVATAIRTQKQPSNLENLGLSPDASEVTWELAQKTCEPEFEKEYHGRAFDLKNSLLVMRAALGITTFLRTSLEKAAPIRCEEVALVDQFMGGFTAPQFKLEETARLQLLDDECRLAAYDPHVSPASLLLLQATLPFLPVSWKKYSLPAISRQVRKLVTEVNARMPDHHRLVRLSAWGYNVNTAQSMSGSAKETPSTQYMSAREVVTTTGKLSQKEHEIVDCFEAVAQYQHRERRTKLPGTVEATTGSSNNDAKFTPCQAGSPPGKHDGRLAFLLAFAKAEEIEVFPKGGNPEVVNVLFCGDPGDPLLVQRIGKARREAEASMAEPQAGSSGAKAVPSLGYVDRAKDRALVEAAEQAVADRWKQGRTVALPLPPPGFQWNLSSDSENEGEAEEAVKLTAKLTNKGQWQFSIGGVQVEPFDARKVISPCTLDTKNHEPVDLGPEKERLVRIALYCDSDIDRSPQSVLETLSRLHDLAMDARRIGANEGKVYDWLPLATGGNITPTVWRDAILALKTRENEDLILGPVLADGTCKRDMTEGCILRIYHVLESLYPTVLMKKGALKWRVRQRGAGYNHMLGCLKLLSRGVGQQSVPAKPMESAVAPVVPETVDASNGSRKHLSRRAATACKTAVASLAASDGDNDGLLDETLKEAEYRVDEGDYLPLPKVTTKLWPHQEASVRKVVDGVKQGRRGHADASAVGAGKTLTALAAVVELAAYMEEAHGKRNGTLVMLPTKALVKEWLLQLATHTSGFHVVEQREDGQLFSLTYGKSSPPIDGNTIVISTLDRVREHPFKNQAAWDLVLIDECLAIQNADAKRCPSAWRQIEVSTLGVLMLSATFFRSKYSDLFYMIRMLRTPFPRTMEWLPTTIHEHIVCQIPETDRSWSMRGKPVPLPPAALKQYRAMIEAYKRKQLNKRGESQDFRRLFADLESFIRVHYEGRQSRSAHSRTSVMAEACFEACKELLEQGRRPLVFADTMQEAEHLRDVLSASGLNTRKWATVARDNVAGSTGMKHDVIIAVKSVEGQGINMQGHADAIVCRPTPGDFLEQMKGRIDRPGQMSKNLVLVVLMAEHTIEEAKFANIHLCGSFFREYIAPVATRYRERIDLEAALAAGGTGSLQRGTVSQTWRRSLEAAGQSGTFARVSSNLPVTSGPDTTFIPSTRSSDSDKASTARGSAKRAANKVTKESREEVPQFAPLNKVLRNRGDPEAVREAKERARNGHASRAVRNWLFPPKKPKATGLPKESLLRFSDAQPPVVLDQVTVRAAVAQLSKDPKLGALIARVGADALAEDCGEPESPNNARLFDNLVRAITFTMVSVDAGNSFLRRLAMKIGVCIEQLMPVQRKARLQTILAEIQNGTSEYDRWTTQTVLDQLLEGITHGQIFTPVMLSTLISSCLVIDGKQSGYPHLCGVTSACGKKDDPALFLAKARHHAAGGDVPVSAGYSKMKADFFVALVDDFESGKVSAEKINRATDREAAIMLLGLKGIGDWSAGQVLMHFLKRADIMIYGDLTVRNYLNDLYNINHNEVSETMLESAADFPDTRENRNLIDKIATENGWKPYRTVVCLLMYHLQEENLVLL